MRLWHKDLISVLPRQQLLAQWRECCCIARNISVNGTPNHLLVNKLLDYPLIHFRTYSYLVYREMKKRGYTVNKNCFTKYFTFYNWLSHKKLYADWHNDRYLLQCYYNLQEKYDCGGISEKEWELMINYIQSKTSN